MEREMKNLLKKLVRDEQGQDVIEYALLAAAISVIAIPVVPGIGTSILAVYTNVAAQVTAIPGA
jgi:pilus assembly protein Flp/PilA